MTEKCRLKFVKTPQKLTKASLIQLAVVGALFVSALSSAHAAVAPFNVQLTLSSPKVIDGGILRVDADLPVSPARASEFSLSFEKRVIPTIILTKDKEAKTTAVQWVVPIPFTHAPGKVTLELSDGKSNVLSAFEIIDGKYPQEKLKVAEKHVNPPKKVFKRIQKEQHEIGLIYRNHVSTKYWSGPFALPIDSRVTSVFGSKRVYNGKLAGFHKGVDLKAAVGTPVLSPSDGKVVLAQDLYFTGYTVILDHGFGIFTIYGHMSKLKVKVGTVVSQKQVLGLAGKTGRSSGPHLHWGAVILGEKVSPMELTQVMK